METDEITAKIDGLAFLIILGGALFKNVYILLAGVGLFCLGTLIFIIKEW
jgi:hypothetical protein